MLFRALADLPIVYPGALTPRAQIALGVLVAALNAGVYAWALRRRRG